MLAHSPRGGDIMGMIIIPCLFVVALMAILIIILAVKACNSEKSENRLSFCAGIILAGIIAAVPGWWLYELFSYGP